MSHENYGHQEEQRQGQDDVGVPLDARRAARREELVGPDRTFRHLEGFSHENHGHQEEQRQGQDDVGVPLDARRAARRPEELTDGFAHRHI